MSFKFNFLILFISFISFGLLGQGEALIKEKVDAQVQRTHAQWLGKVSPKTHPRFDQATPKEKKDFSKQFLKQPRNFEGRGKRSILKPELEHQGPDKIRQWQSGYYKDNINVVPRVNVEGLTVGTSPNDPSIDVGAFQVVQAVNVTTIGVFDKSGNLIETFSGNSLWAPFGLTSRGDPIILYDQEAERWIITEFPNDDQVLIAVSETSDALGNYNIYNFATPFFPDYPKYAVWDSVYTLTTNEGASGGLAIYILDKPALLAGDQDPSIQRILLPREQRTEAGFFVATPVDWTGQTKPNSNPSFLALNDSSWGNAAEDEVLIYEVDVDFEDNLNTEIFSSAVTLSPYDANPCAAQGQGFACIPQPNGQGLDGLPELITNQPHYRNFGTHETIVFSFISDVTDGQNLSGIRWVELRREGGDWFLYQEGTYAPDDGLHRFMCSICIDGEGNIGLGYNVANDSTFVGARFTGRLPTDSLGQMTVNEVNLVDGGNTIRSGTRFGDYAHMTIDPIDDRTFWFTTEYAQNVSNGDVATRIAAFSLEKDDIDIGPLAFISPSSSSDLTDSEVLEVSIANFGRESRSVFQVGYKIDNGSPIMEDVNIQLDPDSTYNHTFSSTLNLSELKDYNIEVFSVLSDDQFLLNDTLSSVVTKIPKRDLTISNVEGFGSLFCGGAVTLTLSNLGADIFFEGEILVELNGQALPSILVDSPIFPETTIDLPYVLPQFEDGTNELQFTVNSFNNDSDQVLANNVFNVEFEANSNADRVTLVINADRFPGETSWTLETVGGTVLEESPTYSSQELGFTQIRHTWCLNPDSCYQFVIADFYNDGICCTYGNGNYNIQTDNGVLLVESDGNFGAGETQTFCLNEQCTFEIEVDVSNASAMDVGDGLIMINTLSGIGPYSYSIDGGVTFQDESIFDMLLPGDYEILVEDGQGCAATTSVFVDFSTSTSSVPNLDAQVEILPNPTDGIFIMNIRNLEFNSPLLDVDIYNSNGQWMRRTVIAKYDDVYTGQVSLLHEINGLYLIKLVHPEINQLIKVVKQ